MYHLATVLSFLNKYRLPITRDQAMLLMIAINQIFLGIDTWLSHMVSYTIVPNEAIPIYFGFTAGFVLLVAGIIANRNRDLASIIATVTLLLSICVGLLGWFFHLKRALMPYAELHNIVDLYRIVWSPPLIAPLVFSLVGLIGISAAWVEIPADSGKLRVVGDKMIILPYSKTRAYFYMVSLGAMATLFSSALDHGRPGFENPWLWLPLGVGIFATVVPFFLAIIDRPHFFDVLTYMISMVLMALVGIVGLILHIRMDLTAGGEVVIERFIRGAPFLAPLLFADVAGLGFIILMDPAEDARKLKLREKPREETQSLGVNSDLKEKISTVG